MVKLSNAFFHSDTVWKQNAVTVAGGNGQGDQLNQLFNPQCIFVDDDQAIYIADSSNNRIIEWKYNETTGQIVAGGNGKGSQMHQLDHPGDILVDAESNTLIICDLENKRVVQWPRQGSMPAQIFTKDIECNSIAMDTNGSLYISDSKKNEVRRWRRGEKNGTIVAGGHGQGNGFHQLNYPTCVFVDKDHSVYVSDCLNHRVMKWIKDAKEGIVVAGGHDAGDSSIQLYCPQGVTTDQVGTVYVADWGNHRVMRWFPDADEGTTVVGGNEKGQESNQMNNPVGLSFDIQGNLYVSDSENHRIQKFEIE